MRSEGGTSEGTDRPGTLRARRPALAAAAALVVLCLPIPWILDVLLNQELAGKLLATDHIVAHPSDFFGLFLAGANLAVLAVLGGLAAGWIVTLVARRGDPLRQSVPVVAGILGACAVLVVLDWPFDAEAGAGSLVAGLLAGAGLLAALRLAAPSQRGESRLVALASDWILLPVLFLAAAADSFARPGLKGRFYAGGLALAAAAAWGLLIGRKVQGLRAAGIRLAPAGLAVVLAVAACIVSGTRDRAPGPLPAATPDKPSIVLIVLDTVRADHLHRFGYARDTMPALEAWARDALTVERAVTPGGWTSPSHASIFTGLSVSEHGVHYAGGSGGNDEHLGTLPVEGLPWITNRLSTLGYHCIAVSANSLAIPHEMTGWSRHVEPRRVLWLPSTLAGLGDLVSPLSRRISEKLLWRMPYADASEIVDITMRAVPPRGGPVFLFVNMMDAHSPYNPPAAALRSLGVDPHPPFGLYATHRDLTREWKDLPPGTGEALADLYDGELRSMDTQLQRLLPWIDERFGKNALVIVASDHGEELGEKGRVGHEYGLSQRILHVPLFVKGDGVRGGDDNEVASLVNLYDYILAAASGATPDEAILSQPGEHGILSERYPSGYNAARLGPAYGRAWVSLIEDDLKVVGPPDEGLRLYDLGREGFSSEVPLAMTPEAAVLGGRIADYWSARRDQRTGDEGRAAESKERLRRLKALGYVE